MTATGGRDGATGAPGAGGGVYLVAGGDLVAVFADPDSAHIQLQVMTGANLDTILRHVPESTWEALRTRLYQHPGITIVDVRQTPTAGA